MSLFEQVQEAVATTLNVPAGSIAESSGSENVAAWDSLGQVNLMMALEQTFDLQLEVEDFAKLTSVRAILDYLHSNGFS